MERAFSLRLATAADAGALARCRADLFHELHNTPNLPAGFESACASTLEAYLAADTCVAWIAEAATEREPIGNLVLLTFPRLPSPTNFATNEGYLLNVFVAPAWRHRGVASALVGSAVTHARSSGLARIRLHATVEGRDVYAKQGFVTRDNEMELDLVRV